LSSINYKANIIPVAKNNIGTPNPKVKVSNRETSRTAYFLSIEKDYWGPFFLQQHFLSIIPITGPA
jgi:hypothetical protein